MKEKRKQAVIIPLEIHVASWAPTGKPLSEVHLRFETKFGEIVVRIKGRKVLDEIVRALQDHGDEVFGAGGGTG